MTAIKTLKHKKCNEAETSAEEELDRIKLELSVVTRQRDYAIRLLHQRGVSAGVSATSLDMLARKMRRA
jgi:hypothetical protein